MRQILEEYNDMQELQEKCLDILKVPRGGTIQMLYRLGYADSVPPTYRQPLAAIIRA